MKSAIGWMGSAGVQEPIVSGQVRDFEAEKTRHSAKRSGSTAFVGRRVQSIPPTPTDADS
jgi:hypothetical protein